MNIYEKLQEMRVELQNMDLKKSGQNKFAGYTYYQLSDVLPYINQLMQKHKVTSIVSFEPEKAILTLINTEKPDESIQFVSPMASASLKGAHEIQNLGAVETYQRRYLYMTAFEIVEADVLDATQGKEPPAQQRPVQQKTRTAQKKDAKKTENPNLSAASKERINAALKEYTNMMDVKMSEAVNSLEKESGVKLAEATEDDVERIIGTIDSWFPF